MAKEIERKYLVKDNSYRDLATETVTIAQGYLNRDPERTVRIRVWDNQGFITVKTRNHGLTRNEWEYGIPLADAREMLQYCERPIEKIRYIIPVENGLKWEIDEFGGRLEGLVVAEIEIPTEETLFTLPDFIGREVTGDPAYYNSNL